MINVSQAFHRTSANPVDDTMALTKADMLTVNDNLMPDYYFTICQDDGYIYLYDKSATASASTGKFKKFEGGGSGGGGTSEPTIINKTLTAAGWSNKQQTINFTGYDTDLGGVMGVPHTATAAQKEAYSEAIVNVVSQSGTSFTFSCENVPEIDLPVTLYAGGGGAGGGGSADFPEGGTTGQVLAKASNDDNDVEWKTIDADKTQYTTMPTASADNLGQIVQYVGETTVIEPIYIKGLFYQCVSDGESTPTYSWEQADVQSYPEADLTNVFSSGMPVASVSGDRRFNYQTDEHEVGTWIDGRAVYQIVCVYDSEETWGANTWHNTSLSVSGIDLITDVVTISSSGTASKCLMGAKDDGRTYVQILNLRNNTLSVKYAIMQYVKTS